MDLLTRDELEAIATPSTDGIHVSLFMPTQRVSRDSEADRLRWKNLITGVESALADTMRRPDVEALVRPARELLDDVMEWQYMSDGLAMFLNAEGHRTYRVPAPMTTLATIGDRHVLGPLARLVSGDEHFLMLALSQQQIRLLEGSRNTVEDVYLEDVPTSLKDVVTPPDSRSDTVARPVAPGRGRAIFHGHGAGDDHLKQAEVQRFIHAVANGVQDLLGAQTSPLVLLGLEHLVVAYRNSNRYPHLVDESVMHNADGLSDAELHRMAWPIVEQRLQDRRAEVFARFTELHGTGRVSSDLTAVSKAAEEGKIETLFVRADPWAWERATDDLAPVVKLGTGGSYALAELVDRAVAATLTHGGHVYATAQTVVPDADVAAIYRY